MHTFLLVLINDLVEYICTDASPSTFFFLSKNKWKAQGIYLVNFIVKAFIFDRNGTFEKDREKVCNLFTI